MPTVSRRTYNLVQNVLRERAIKVKYGKTWQEIHEQWAVGRVSGNMLCLDEADRGKLRDMLASHVGADPLHVEVNGDRIEVAAKFKDEKLSQKGPFEGMLQITRHGRPVSLCTGDATVPPDSFLTVDKGGLSIDPGEPVIVVENGIVLRHWERYVNLLPSSLTHSHVVYRGHDRAARTVLEVLDSLRGRNPVIGFFDYDLAGLSMAASMGVDGILVPYNPVSFINNRLDKPTAFTEQYAKFYGLEYKLPVFLRPHFHWMLEHSTCLMQEHMANLREDLVMCSCDK